MKKLDEIRELLSIPRNADYSEILSIAKWWRETGSAEPSVPAELTTEVNRLICDLQSLNETDMEILDKLTSKTSTQPEL